MRYDVNCLHGNKNARGKFNKLFKRSLLVSAVAGAAVSGGTQAVADDTFLLEEVIITASKRALSLQDTPIAVSVVGQEAIKQAKVVDITDLQALVPSLRVTPLERSASTGFAIRGFSNGSGGAGVEPSVGVFIDGVFRSRSSGTILDLPRLERVEVLSGPQSTLFGKNASAGVISIVTAKPSREFEAEVEAGVGNYDQRQVKGYVTGGVSDTLAVSLSGGMNKRDGYTKSLTGFNDLNNRDRWNVRGQALFEPSEHVNFRLVADFSEIEEYCCSVSNLINGGTAGVIQALGGQILDTEDPFAYESVLNRDQLNEIEDGGLSLHANVDFEGFTFTSLTAYRRNESRTNGDIAYTSLGIGEGVSSIEIDTLSQEFRLTSTSDGSVSWMLGAFLFKEDIDTGGYTLYGDDLRNYVNTLIGGTLPLLESLTGNASGSFFAPGLEIEKAFAQSNEAYSVFGTVDYHINESLTATFGLNYTSDDKEITATQVQNPDAFSALDLDVVAGGAFSALKGLQFRTQLLEYPNAVEDGKSSDSDTTWLTRVAYELSDDINVYASIATGFKSSSWDLSDFSHPLLADAQAIADAGIETPNQQYGSRNSAPEEAMVFELGLKARFDNSAVNIAIFDQSIENFQTRGFDGVNFISTNAGKLSSKGLEFDVVYAPSESWTITLGGTYLDPIYDRYDNAPPPIGESQPIDRSGTRPGGIHELSLSGSVVYKLLMDNGVNAYIRTDYLYESDTKISDNFPQLSRKVNTVNASAGVSLSNGISAQLWARNLNNDEYIFTGFPGVAQPGTINSFPNQPRTYGASVSYEF